MTLDNSAKIGDIITALEGMQAINQKAELASVIGSPATATDNIATQITKIQGAKDVFAEKIGVENTTPLQQMAESLVVGKKWASGTVTVSTSNLTITGLSFQPSIVFAIRKGTTFTANSTIAGWMAFYCKPLANYSFWTQNAGMVIPYVPTVTSSSITLPLYNQTTAYYGEWDYIAIQ